MKMKMRFDVRYSFYVPLRDDPMPFLKKTLGYTIRVLEEVSPFRMVSELVIDADHPVIGWAYFTMESLKTYEIESEADAENALEQGWADYCTEDNFVECRTSHHLERKYLVPAEEQQ